MEKKETKGRHVKVPDMIKVFALIIGKIIAYDLTLFFFTLVLDIFFRDIKTTGTFNIPSKGPVVFVIAPHANQFVDPVIVMSKVKEYSGRRVSFLIAAKSFRRKFIGLGARVTGAIPVERAQDLLKSAKGEIFIEDLKDGTVVQGRNTKFTKQCMEKGLIGLPKSLGNAVIAKIESDTKLYLKKPFQINLEQPSENDEEAISMLHGGTKFKTAPHVDNHAVFNNVFDHLIKGGALGIFPEGGSHDRPSLLPFKPGVAIMALGAAAKAEEPDLNIQIVPVGLNYFHPHRFRSRAVVEFGKPILVTKEDGDRYDKDPRGEVAKLLDTITLALKDVTVTCDDFDTLLALQAARRLYTSANRDNLPLPLVVDMNRRLVQAYKKHENEPKVIEMKRRVALYNKNLRAKGLHDHQVDSLTRLKKKYTFGLFLSRLTKMILFFGLSLPGFLLFCPVFICSTVEARRRQKEALAGSVVKIKAKDVLGTWKILVALGLAPLLYTIYSIVGTYLILKWHLVDLRPAFIFVLIYGWSILTTYASLRVGEIGVDYYKSLKPLLYSALSSSQDIHQLEELKEERKGLQKMVTDFYNTFEPDIYQEFSTAYKEYREDYAHGEKQRERFGSVNPYSDMIRTINLNQDNLKELPIFSIPGVNDILITQDNDLVNYMTLQASGISTNTTTTTLKPQSSDENNPLPLSLEQKKLRLRNSILNKRNQTKSGLD